MSSLRRRAIWVQRAMSTERSSIGARASARTTAGASPGSASSRSQASTSRTSARWKKAASPTKRCATARSSSATATACPSRAVSATITAIWPGATLAGDQPLDLGRHRLGLRAIVRAPPELDLAVRRHVVHDRRTPAPPRAAASTAGGQRCDEQPTRASCRSLSNPLIPAAPARGSAAARLRVAGDGERAVRPPRARASPRQIELLAIVEQQMLERRAVAGCSRSEIASANRSPASRAPAPAADARGLGKPRRTRARAALLLLPAQLAYCSASISSALRRSIRRTKPPISAPALPPKSW